LNYEKNLENSFIPDFSVWFRVYIVAIRQSICHVRRAGRQMLGLQDFDRRAYGARRQR